MKVLALYLPLKVSWIDRGLRVFCLPSKIDWIGWALYPRNLESSLRQSLSTLKSFLGWVQGPSSLKSAFWLSRQRWAENL